jgi:uncharacterized membrane protein
MASLRISAFALLVLLLSLHPLTATAQLKLTYTIVDAPGDVSTYVLGINNNGVLSGFYGDNTTSANFTWNNGVFSYFNVPGEVYSQANGINDSNQVVGYYSPDGTNRIGFVYDGANFTYFQYPNAQYTQPYGINNAGLIVGAEEPVGGIWTGLLYDGTKFHTIAKGSDYVFLGGVNNLGDVVGAFIESVTTGFLRSKGRVFLISYPGAVLTSPNGINDNGIIAGNYYLSADSSCFVFKNGKFKSFSIPNVKDTFCLGINNAGVLVGYVSDFGMHVAHGFYTSPVTNADFK